MSIQETLTAALATYSVSDAAIAEMKERCAGLTIAGVDDKEGEKIVRDNRLVARRWRLGVEKRRNELLEDARLYTGGVNGRAKALREGCEGIEKPLQAEENRIKAEREQIVQAAERKRQLVIQNRLEALAKYRRVALVSDVEALSDAEFMVQLTEAREAHEEKQRAEEAERKRRQKEDDDRKTEAERLRKEREKLAEDQQKLDEQAKRVREDTHRHRTEVLAELGYIATTEELDLPPVEFRELVERIKVAEPEVEPEPEPASEAPQFYCEKCDGTSLGEECKNPDCPEPIEELEAPKGVPTPPPPLEQQRALVRGIARRVDGLRTEIPDVWCQRGIDNLLVVCARSIATLADEPEVSP